MFVRINIKICNEKSSNFQINLEATLNRMMAKNFFILFDVPMQIIFYSQIFTLIKIKWEEFSLRSLPNLNRG